MNGGPTYGQLFVAIVVVVLAFYVLPKVIVPWLARVGRERGWWD